MVVGKRNVRKYVILPSCLCVLEATEEVIVYKLQQVGNEFARAGAILGMYLIGFSVVALLISPLIERWLEAVYATGRRRGGVLGVLGVVVLIFGGLFGLFYAVYICGPQSVLPAAWRNPTG